MSTSETQIQGLDRERLLQAVAIYLERAYPGCEPPEPVKRRIAWEDGVQVPDLLRRAPFERVQNSEDGTTNIYGLRLGNLRYPHMKLQIQAWPNPEGFLLSVNTHDQVLSINPNARDLEAFRALQAENQTLKEQIEQAWDEAGLPTFLRYLRNYISAHTPPDEPTATA